MGLKEFLLDLSTNPAAMARFRRDPRICVEKAELSEEERRAVLEGDPATLKTLLYRSNGRDNDVFTASTPTQPPPSPTPPPEMEIEPHEPVDIEPPVPPPEPPPSIIEPPPDQEPEVDIDEGTSVPAIMWNMARLDSMWESGGLTIVGMGIRGGLQTTPESQLCIREASVVLYLVADPISEAWIQELNPNSDSLSNYYQVGRRRLEIYNNIVEKVMEVLRAQGEVCFVLYGHPGVLAYPARESMRRARQEGFAARMFPGVSALDNLFADLGVDFGAVGLQSYEVTRFLLHRYQFDPHAGLILWQIGVLGETKWNPPHAAARGRLRVLADYLAAFYGPDHRVVLYHAPEFVTGRPKVECLTLADMPDACLFSTSTLYVPPKGQPIRDAEAEKDLMLEIC